MKRFLKALGTVVACVVVVLFTSCWVASAFVELPQKQSDPLEWFDIAWIVLVILAAIYTIWRLLKFTVYQLCFTVTKAIEDAKRSKDTGVK